MGVGAISNGRSRLRCVYNYYFQETSNAPEENEFCDCFVIRNLYLQGLQPGAKVTVASLLLRTGNSSTTFEYIDFKIDFYNQKACFGKV